MKDLIEKILVYLPQYLVDFGLLLSRPKRFIAQKNPMADDTFTQSLIFLGVSFVIVMLLGAPFRPETKDLWSFLGRTAVLGVLYVSLGAVALRLAWRIVGGKATTRSFFVIYAYQIGVIICLHSFFSFLAKVFATRLNPNYMRS